jgi:L,D-transpeptidase YcbB
MDRFFLVLFFIFLNINSSYASNTIVVDRSTHTLTLFKDGDIVKEYDIIIGKKKTPTPAFTTNFTTIDINPTWYPTATSIKELKKYPELIKHYGVIFNGDKVYSPPSDHNPLGKARLNLNYNIKIIRIHGTGQPELFETDNRQYSSGCIRVLEITDLVENLTDKPIDWDKKYTIKLNEPVSVEVR